MDSNFYNLDILNKSFLYRDSDIHHHSELGVTSYICNVLRNNITYVVMK